jgi:Protein of unknown function (DUF2550)
MRIVEIVGIGLLIVLVVLGLLFFRRGVIARRGGTIEVSVRLSTIVPGRGWSSGLARFTGDELRWYRIFSFSIRPRRVFSRGALAVQRRRSPDGPERLVLPADWVVVRCVSQRAPVEMAMAEPTLTGFLSWVEGAPPGGSFPDRPPRRFRAG